MAEQKVELRKIRDLSENLNDTFTFIRQNFKPLVTSFLGIAGIVMLANAIMGGYTKARPETFLKTYSVIKMIYVSFLVLWAQPILPSYF
jgi:hypothetical protein